jgi:pectinesterase
MHTYTSSLLTLLLLAFCLCTQAQKSGKNLLRSTDPTFLKSKEAARIGDQLLLYQRDTGGWPKNIDMTRPLTDEERRQIAAEKGRRDDSTTDNGATSSQLVFLARLYQATHTEKYRQAVNRGLEYLLSGQYDNGGWPQFWPAMRDYQPHITYNDDAMYHTLVILRDVAWGKEPYGGKLVDKKMRDRAQKALDKGIDCILATQLSFGGEPAVWCQQYDEHTLKPAPARAFELAAYCSLESASLVDLLMSLPNPTPAVVKAVNGAMRWFDRYKITGYRLVKASHDHPEAITHLEPDATAGPLWARFYDLQRCEPFVCDRDGIPRRHLTAIGKERRDGYGWYNDAPKKLYSRYEAWKKRHGITDGPVISLNSRGGNETGVFVLFRKPTVDSTLFDVVVHEGESIQKAIEQAPADGDKPFKILLRKGTYQQKVIIDKPHIVLVGEQRDSTRIVYAELCKKMKPTTYHGQEVGPGVVTLTELANDCILSGLTVYNDYGSTVERTTAHQMAIFGKATRTIVINCNVISDGNDALALWAPKGGMYYHADLLLHCWGVDFLCPRGWCFATRCKFMGDGHAMIWHDGRADRNAKLVITDSQFDAHSPTLLGRYHHNSQFYLLNCSLSDKVLDENIHYAYSDKVLDSCVWGQRTYYWHCYRKGGHGTWLNDNLDKADSSPEFYQVTAQWTFNRRWNPEKVIRDLWPVLAYEPE